MDGKELGARISTSATQIAGAVLAAAVSVLLAWTVAYSAYTIFVVLGLRQWPQ
jgi:hypothetical protein